MTLADILVAARREGRQVTALPEALVPPDADAAYAVAAEVAGADVAQTLHAAGAKLETGEPLNYMFIPLQSV